VQEIIARRKSIFAEYDRQLNWQKIKKPAPEIKGFQYNYAYYPVVFESESAFLKIREALNKQEIFPRRYFFPSLNQLPYVKNYQPCPISEDISVRVASLPLYYDLAFEDVKRICEIINENL
jgi:dTDP-4-amino-4,6-dideoxygalactose transaminase